MRVMPAEWEKQQLIQITWPNADTDWAPILREVTEVYKQLAEVISLRQQLMIVSRDRHEVLRALEGTKANIENITFVDTPIDDTWARDHSFITVREDGRTKLLDFRFNGWGGKFAAERDNAINAATFGSALLDLGYYYENHLNTILEGGSIESDGNGTIMTTTRCLLSRGRNDFQSKAEAEDMLHETLGAEHVLWLDHGGLMGDDTDGHIDTLARFAPNNTILYVKCDYEKDPNYPELKAMEEELRELRNKDGEPYRLIPLPHFGMAKCFFEAENRTAILPVTYANFLYINNGIIFPSTNTPKDKDALDVFRREFPDREIISVNAMPLLVQGGSIHCSTMQYFSI
ncbi:MAG: agmatine deiminase family protein [Marinilabiliaceae bacterium]|nr:agmatine deiminase family protein [Marinilabiliaceae bacterium]